MKIIKRSSSPITQIKKKAKNTLKKIIQKNKMIKSTNKNKNQTLILQIFSQNSSKKIKIKIMNLKKIPITTKNIIKRKKSISHNNLNSKIKRKISKKMNINNSNNRRNLILVKKKKKRKTMIKILIKSKSNKKTTKMMIVVKKIILNKKLL